MLAAIPGELIGLVIFAVAALLKWLGDRATEQESTKLPPGVPRPSREKPDPVSSRRGDPEAERKRRFMEALGIPTEDVAGPSHDRPQVLRPEFKAEAPTKPRESRTKPIPPIVYVDPVDWRKPRGKQASTPPPLLPPPIPQQPAPVFIPVAAPVHEVEAGLDKRDDLVELQGLSIGDLTEERSDAARGSTLAVLREELRTPEALRRAFLLREILGPPLGLQSPGSAPSFRGP